MLILSARCVKMFSYKNMKDLEGGVHEEIGNNLLKTREGRGVSAVHLSI